MQKLANTMGNTANDGLASSFLSALYGGGYQRFKENSGQDMKEEKAQEEP